MIYMGDDEEFPRFRIRPEMGINVINMDKPSQIAGLPLGLPHLRCKYIAQVPHPWYTGCIPSSRCLRWGAGFGKFLPERRQDVIHRALFVEDVQALARKWHELAARPQGAMEYDWLLMVVS